jgi:hypothetical protein
VSTIAERHELAHVLIAFATPRHELSGDAGRARVFDALFTALYRQSHQSGAVGCWIALSRI